MTETWWVASGNPVKLRAVERAWARLEATRAIKVRPLDLPSEVAAQPVGETETRQGARLRVLAARRQEPDGAGWVGLEGGVTDIEGTLYGIAWRRWARNGRGAFRSTWRGRPVFRYRRRSPSGCAPGRSWGTPMMPSSARAIPSREVARSVC